MCPSIPISPGSGVESTPDRPQAVAVEEATETNAASLSLCIGPDERGVRRSRPFVAFCGAGEARETDASSRGERSAGCGPGGAAPAPAALPCQNSNNSDRKRKRYRLKQVPGSEDFYTSKDNPKAYWTRSDADTIHRWGQCSSADAKAAFHLRNNVASFIRFWGRNHCLFFTLTDEANLQPTQFARR